MKPLIGITCGIGLNITNLNMQHMPAEQHRLSDAYVKAVALAGGIPVIIPVYEDISLVRDVIDRMDGVILSGGGDPDSARYSQRATARLGAVSPRRDAFDFEVAEYVMNETTKPVLGICRGTQVMNVAAGGSLHIDLKDDGKLEHMLNMYPRNMQSHTIEVAQDTKLAQIVGEGNCPVNSFHHEAVKNEGQGFQVSAYSIPDGVVEAIEMSGERFVVGVQWHPEEMTHMESQLEIFRTLVNAAAQRKNADNS